LITRSRLLASAVRVGLAGALTAGIFVLSLGVDVSSSGASGFYSASEASFCKSLVTWSVDERKYAAPTGTGLTAYRAWAKELLPLYETLAANAPNSSSKLVLNDVVTILKDYYGSKSLSKLEAYEVANHAKFLTDTKSLAKAIEGCASYF
jgi:hypothetical protein